MHDYGEQFGRILSLLDEHGAKGMNVTSIARELGITRISAAKYLELLAASGDVSMERFGQKKLYRRSRRLPLPEVFDRLPNALVILDGDLQVRMVNASFVATLGIQGNRNLVGVPLLDLDLPVFSEVSVRRNIERIRRGETYLDEMRLIDDGTDRVYHVDFAPIVSPAEGSGIMVSLRDITALRRAETALRDSERKMATLFETVPSGIVIFDSAGTILDANRASLRLLGLRTFEQLSAGTIFTLPCTPEKMETLIAKGVPAETELACDFDRMKRERVQSTKAGVAYFDVIFTPIRRDGGGPPTEFAILFKDITRDRRERRDLSLRETRYHAFFENAANGVIIFKTVRDGDDFVFKDLNRAAEQILGVRKEEIVGRSVYDIYPDLADRELREMGTIVLRSDTPVFLPPLQYRKGHGSWIRHYLFCLPSGELASFMIDASGERESDDQYSSAPGNR
ncbi:MAG: PAS domain S-box protein [Methanospirillum sp.]|nr:PAS domain S-box protein [Methanospirillum sp.]